MAEHDDLIRRLRQRAADPERRVDQHVSAFAAGVGQLDPAELIIHLGRAQDDLARALAAGPEGPPPELVERAMALAGQMSAPAEPDLRGVARPDGIESVGIVLGIALPAVLRRALREIADGGFGPGHGLFGTAELVRTTARCRREAEDIGDRWPSGLLAIADLGGGVLACVATDQPDAPVVVYDPERLADLFDPDLEDEPDGPGVLADAFVPESPSLVAWLEEWAGSPSPAEREAASLASMAADIWAQEPVDELDHMRREWLREQGLVPPDA